MLTFKKLTYICTINRHLKYVDNCFHILQYENCIFQHGVVMPRDRVVSLYNFRFDMALEAKTRSDVYLADFKSCVEALIDSKEEAIGMTSITGDKASFLIFYEPESNNILGILKSETSMGIMKEEENATAIVEKGHSSGVEKYFKGAFVKKYE